jgi:hypothetical protein
MIIRINSCTIRIQRRPPSLALPIPPQTKCFAPRPGRIGIGIPWHPPSTCQATRLMSITSHPHLIHFTALEKSWNTGKILGNLFLTFESFERQKSKAAHGQPLEGLPFPAQHCSELAAWKMLRCELHGCPMVSAIYAIYINLCHLCMSICSFSPTKDLRKS